MEMLSGACWIIKQLCARLSFGIIIASSHNEYLGTKRFDDDVGDEFELWL